MIASNTLGPNVALTALALVSLLASATTEEFRWALGVAAQLKPSDAVSGLGSTLHAHRSVVTAMACFAATPTDFEFAVGRAIGLGDDTDTVAAMTGALVGAFAGVSAVPAARIAQLEEQGKGGEYIAELATRLLGRHRVSGGQS